MAGTQTLSILCWNVYHGRDYPPDPSLFATRSRLLGRPEDNGEYFQVNRSLEREFAEAVVRRDWSACILQECPPAWSASLARHCGAQSQRVLTSRNQLGFLRRAIGRRLPDLIGANEGGSNLTLVRPPWRVVERRALLLNPWPARRLRERRRMGFVRLCSNTTEVCLTNLHASASNQSAAEEELRSAADRAVEWSAGAPLLLAGDFNLRPRESDLFTELETRFGLTGATSPGAIDHILHRGLVPLGPTRPWAAQERDIAVTVEGQTRLVRLSDHAPIEASFELTGSRTAPIR